MELYLVVDPFNYVLRCLFYIVTNTRLIAKLKEWLSNIIQRFGRTETPIEGNDVDIEDVSFMLNVFLIKENILAFSKY